MATATLTASSKSAVLQQPAFRNIRRLFMALAVIAAIGYTKKGQAPQRVAA